MATTLSQWIDRFGTENVTVLCLGHGFGVLERAPVRGVLGTYAGLQCETRPTKSISRPRQLGNGENDGRHVVLVGAGVDNELGEITKQGASELESIFF